MIKSNRSIEVCYLEIIKLPPKMTKSKKRLNEELEAKVLSAVVEERLTTANEAYTQVHLNKCVVKLIFGKFLIEKIRFPQFIFEGCLLLLALAHTYYRITAICLWHLLPLVQCALAPALAR